MIAMASMVGAPLTVGAHARWPLYAAWLKRGDPTLLLALAADTFMAAALWMVLLAIWRQMQQQQGETRWVRPSALLAVFVLVTLVLVLGIAPGMVNTDAAGLKAAEISGISALGLGLLYVLPWLVGAWLARMRRMPAGGAQRTADVRGTEAPDGQATVDRPAGRALGRIGEFINLDWFYRAAGWLGRGLEGAIFWLGQVGEGDGWWGWALIFLAVGVILFTAR
jgi:hypothetical protein